MDDTDPSLRAQHAKFEFDAHIKTQDTYPIREGFARGGIKWETIYDNWSQIKEECLKFTRWLNRHSKIILIVGDENCREWREFVHPDETVEAIKIELDISFPIFGDKPCFQIIRSKATKEIQQLVLFSYHSQYFFYRDISMRIRAYHDLLWNAVSEWAGIRPAKPCFFLRQSDVKQNAGNNPKKQAGDKYGFTQLNLARKLRHQEKRTGTLFPDFVVRRAFRKTINKNLMPTQLAIRTKLLKWDELSKTQQRTFFNTYVIWWTPWCSLGLRYEGDGCPNPDDFDYAGSYHPCVNMERRYRSGEKEEFYDPEDIKPDEAPEGGDS